MAQTQTPWVEARASFQDKWAGASRAARRRSAFPGEDLPDASPTLIIGLLLAVLGVLVAGLFGASLMVGPAGLGLREGLAALLAGEGEAADKLATLEEELARMSRGGRW